MQTKAIIMGAVLALAACSTPQRLKTSAVPTEDPQADAIAMRWLTLKAPTGDDEGPATVRITRNMRVPAENFKSPAITMVDRDRGLLLTHMPNRRWGSVYEGLFEETAFFWSNLYGGGVRTGANADFMRTLVRRESDYVGSKFDRSYLGQETLDGRATHRVRFVPGDESSPIDRWYDVETGFLVQQRIHREADNYDRWDIYSTYEDYRRVDGVLYPFKETRSVGPFSYIYTGYTIETDVCFNRSQFLPAAHFARWLDVRPEDGSPHCPDEG